MSEGMSGNRVGGFGRGALAIVLSRFVLKPDIAIASEVSI